jgi:hypothetical protein
MRFCSPKPADACQAEQAEAGRDPRRGQRLIEQISHHRPLIGWKITVGVV